MMAAQMAQSDSFYLELSSASPEPTIRAWFESARAGQWAIYASGLTLPRDESGPRYVRELERAGKVMLTQRRHPQDARRFQYLVTKRAEPGEPEGAVRRQRGMSAHTLADAKAVLTILREHAAREKPCPTNVALARECGFGTGQAGKSRVAYLLRHLVEAGEIEIASGGPFRLRVVTILTAGRGRGKSTQNAEMEQ